MTRQETVIKITKVTRIVGEMKLQLDLDNEIEFEALDPSWMNIGKWTKEIYRYMEQDYSPLLAGLIANNEFTSPVVQYVQDHKLDIDPTYVVVMADYDTNMQTLKALCEKHGEELKGEYKDLIVPLANGQVADLLQRAIRAGILDKYFQPTAQTKPLQLKVIAYAVSTICKFPSPYVYFEKQWRRENGKRFSTTCIPKHKTELYNTTKALFPEVDFTLFEPVHEAKTFYTPQSEEDIKELYNELIKYGYIDPETELGTFIGIFNKKAFKNPVKWTKTQRQLSYFVYLAFNKFNKKDLWIKGECCFIINGHPPHKKCFVSGYSWIKRAGWLDRYDVTLKAICDKFNHIESMHGKTGKIIHTSKTVFHSPNDERDIHSMYSSLHDGGYISPDTTFAIFKGIFYETEFDRPVVWMKTQSLLMYFVHLAFKSDNPYDLWKKCANCFRLKDDRVPNSQSMDSNFRIIVKRGLLGTYDTRLKAIAESYLGIIREDRDINSCVEVNNNT